MLHAAKQRGCQRHRLGIGLFVCFTGCGARPDRSQEAVAARSTLRGASAKYGARKDGPSRTNTAKRSVSIAPAASSSDPIENLQHDEIPRSLSFLNHAPKRASDAAKRTLSAIRGVQAWLHTQYTGDQERIGALYEHRSFSAIDLSAAPLRPFDKPRAWIQHISTQIPYQGWSLGPVVLELDHPQQLEGTTFLLGSQDDRGARLGWWTQRRALSPTLEAGKIHSEAIASRVHTPLDVQPLPVLTTPLSSIQRIHALYLFRAQVPARFTDPDDPSMGPKSWVFAVFLGKHKTLAFWLPGYDTELVLEHTSLKARKNLEFSGYNTGARVGYRMRRGKQGISLEWIFDDSGEPDQMPLWGRFAWIPTGERSDIPVFSLLDSESLERPQSTGKHPLQAPQGVL